MKFCQRYLPWVKSNALENTDEKFETSRMMCTNTFLVWKKSGLLCSKLQYHHSGIRFKKKQTTIFDSILFFSKNKIKRKVARYPGVFSPANPYLLGKIYMPQIEKHLGVSQVCTYHKKALKSKRFPEFSEKQQRISERNCRLESSVHANRQVCNYTIYVNKCTFHKHNITRC